MRQDQMKQRQSTAGSGQLRREIQKNGFLTFPELFITTWINWTVGRWDWNLFEKTGWGLIYVKDYRLFANHCDLTVLIPYGKSPFFNAHIIYFNIFYTVGKFKLYWPCSSIFHSNVLPWPFLTQCFLKVGETWRSHGPGSLQHRIPTGPRWQARVTKLHGGPQRPLKLSSKWSHPPNLGKL